MEAHRTNPSVRDLPQDLRADRLRARELRRRRRVAHARTTAARSMRPACWSTARRSTASRACATRWCSIADQFVRVVDREAADLRARPRRRVPGHAARAVDRARRGRRSKDRFSSLVLGIVKSAPFQMNMKGPTVRAREQTARRVSQRLRRETRMHVHHEEAHSAADVPARRGRDARAAAARCRWCRRRRRWRRRPPRRSRASSALRAARHGAGLLGAGEGRRDFELLPFICKPLEPFRDQTVDPERPACRSRPSRRRA